MIFDRHHLLFHITPSTMSVVWMSANSSQVRMVHHLPVQTDLRNTPVISQLAIEELLHRLPRRIWRADTLLSVGLPDPCFAQLRLEFADLPRRHLQRKQLIQARHAKELMLTDANLPIGYQQLTEATPTVISQSIDPAVYSAVLGAFEPMSLRPHRIEPLANLAPESLAEAGKGAVNVWSQPGSWSVFQNGESKFQGSMSSGWRTDGKHDALVCARIARYLRSEQAENRGRTLQIMSVSGARIDGLRETARKLDFKVLSRQFTDISDVFGNQKVAA